jgi:hypothetical protein
MGIRPPQARGENMKVSPIMLLKTHVEEMSETGHAVICMKTQYIEDARHYISENKRSYTGCGQESRKEHPNCRGPFIGGSVFCDRGRPHCHSSSRRAKQSPRKMPNMKVHPEIYMKTKERRKDRYQLSSAKCQVKPTWSGWRGDKNTDRHRHVELLTSNSSLLRPLLDNPQFPSHHGQDFERLRQFLLGMGRSNDGANARLPLRHGGKANALRKHSSGKKLAGEFMG